MSETKLKQIIEGAILAADTPISIDQLTQLFVTDVPERAEIRAALEEIITDCEGRGFELKLVASGYRFQVRHELGEWVSRLWQERPPRYSRALLETLALIAYRQPITRGDIEEIRGVSVSTNIMRSLLEREWVRVVGHRDVPGRPAIYATTKSFLDYFNLKSLDELPTLSEIRDLDKVNEELDLDDESYEIRSLELVTDDESVAATDTGQEMADGVFASTDGVRGVAATTDPVNEDEFFGDDLDSVSERVTEIQENIKAFVREDREEEAEDFEEQPGAESDNRENGDAQSGIDSGGTDSSSTSSPEQIVNDGPEGSSETKDEPGIEDESKRP
jgi:segregation and condensation protein B